jgi:hypothetical protein
MRWTENELCKLKDLINEKSNDELARIYGISNSGIRAVLIKNKMKRKYNQGSKILKYEYRVIREDLDKPCKICVSHHSTKRGCVIIRKGNKRTNLHRAIYEENFGDLGPNEVVRHKCDEPSCCEITHLEKGTTQDNINDKVSRDRQTKGVLVNTAILSEEDVKEIKIALIRGSSRVTLSKIYNVSPLTIRDIEIGKSWKHIKFNRKEALKKIVWYYVQKPYEYEIECNKCGGRNLEWSEYAKSVWCTSCQLDVKGTEGVFGGPIPLGAAAVLGMSFDRWDMVNKCVLTYDQELQDYVPKFTHLKMLEKLVKSLKQMRLEQNGSVKNEFEMKEAISQLFNKMSKDEKKQAGKIIKSILKVF